MKVYEYVSTMVPEVRGIICNGCGDAFEPNYSDTTQEFATVDKNNSRYPTPFKFELCETCLTKIVKTFKIVPENFMNETAYVPSFMSDHDLHQKLFDEWKSTDKWNCDENPYKEYYKYSGNEININESELENELDEEIEAFFREQSQSNLTLVINKK